MQIHSMPRGGALGANIGFTKQHRAHIHCFNRHNRQDEMKIPTTRFWRHIHIKTSAPRFDIEMCSGHIYSMTSLPFKVKSSCIAVLVFPSPTVRSLDIVIKTFLIPFNVFKPFNGLTFYATKLGVLRTCRSPVFKAAHRPGQWYILVAGTSG